MEKNSPKGERANIVDRLNSVSEDDRVIQRSAGDILTGLRNAAQGRARTVGGHDTWLSRARVPAEPDPFTDGDAPADERIRLMTAARVRGESGNMQASAETRAQLFGGQGVHGIEPDWLTVEQMVVLAAARAKARRYL